MREIEPARIAEARARIDPAYLGSPLLRATSLDGALGVELALKVETLNPIRSFKGRGTDLFCAELDGQPHLVCASAGNFGQGLARAGTGRGLRVTVFAAEAANRLKIEAMRRFGAEVRLVGADFDAAKGAARAFAAETGARYVEDGAEPAIAEGAGTIGLEIQEAVPVLDAILLPLGNGALATGVGAWYRHAEPGTRIIGVVAAAAPSMRLSFEAGRPVPTPDCATIADGIAVREPVPYAVAGMAGTLDAVVAIDEAAIVQAMRLVHAHLGLVVEPAGVAGLAALLSSETRPATGRIATVLCGGNLTPDQMRTWLG